MLFSATEIRSRLREQPFSGIQIITTTGEAHDVRHPDLVFVAEGYLIVGMPLPKDPSISTNQVTRIALAHIVELRDLPTPTSASSNGTA